MITELRGMLMWMKCPKRLYPKYQDGDQDANDTYITMESHERSGVLNGRQLHNLSKRLNELTTTKISNFPKTDTLQIF